MNLGDIMINTPAFRSRLLNGEKMTGCWLETFNNIAAEIMALAGYDTAIIDLEHGPGSPLDAIQIMQALQVSNCLPVIRITNSDAANIKRALDIGPAGIMCPNIKSAAHAHEAVAASRYGPDGIRGSAPMIVRASGYGANMDAYFEWMEKEFVLIAQIESQSALDELEDIAAIDGIDMLFLGPSDLSAELGAMGDYTTERFLNALEKLENTARSSNKLLGSIPFTDRDAKDLYTRGYSLVVSGCDTLMIREGAKQDVQALREAAAPRDSG